MPKFKDYLYFLPWAIVYFITRLINLTSLPVFADEAIYVRWSQVIKAVETLRFIPLTDGKQPLFMWITVPFFKVFADPLFASRFVSVLAGFVTLTTLYLICVYLNTSRFVKISVCLIYISSTFTFFFDRMALADNLLTTFTCLSLFLSILQIKHLRLDLSLINGGILGLAWLTKSPAIFFITLSIITVLLFHRTLKSLILGMITFFISFSIYNILRLGPQFHMIALRNQDYVWSVTEILHHPFDPLKPHLFDIVHLFSSYLPLGILLLSLILIIFKISKHYQYKHDLQWISLFLAWSLLPLLANAAFAKVFTARYILYTIPPLILAVTFALNNFQKKLIIFIVILSLFPTLILNYHLITDPFTVQLPPTETGYNQDWTSGWGIQSASKYLITRSHEANVIVGTEGYFGTLPDGLQIYTNNIPRLTVFGIGVQIDAIPPKLLDAKAHGDEVYLLINSNRLTIPKSLLNIIHQYPKPDKTQLLLIRI